MATSILPKLEPLSEVEAISLIRQAEKVGAENAHHWAEDTAHELIGLIYDAAVDFGRWPDFLEAFAEALNGRCAALYFMDVRTGEGSFEFSARFDPGYLRSFREYYARINPALPRMNRLVRSGVFGPTHWVIPNEEFLDADLERDWMEPQRILHGLGGTMIREGDLISAISVYRAPHQETFGPKELGLMKVLIPHLQRGLQVHKRLMGTGEEAVLPTVLDRLEMGVLFLNRNGLVVRLNKKAEEILLPQDGLEMRQKRLVATERPDSARLEQLIRVVASGNGEENGGAMQLSRPSYQQPYSVLVVPILTDTHALVPEEASAVVFITDPDTETRSTVGLLRDLYGLTQAEAEVCWNFMKGTDLESMADELGVSVHTIRAQMKSIMAKTGTCRQAELMRVLLKGPAARIRA